MFMSVNEIDPHELSQLQQQEGKLRVIDVREMREIAAGTIDGAEPMPLATVPLRLNELNPEDKHVIVCRSGARSAQACMYLQQNGIKDVLNLRGGLMAWVRQGQPVSLPQAV